MASQTSANGALKLEDIDELLKAYHGKLIDIEKSQRENKVDNKLLREEFKQLLEQLADKTELQKLTEQMVKGIEAVGQLKDSIVHEEQELRKTKEEMKEGMAKAISGMKEEMEKEGGEMKTEMKKVSDGMSIQVKSVCDKIDELMKMFEKPLRKEVHYRHFFEKPLWVIAGLVITVGMVTGVLVVNSHRVERFEENDIKWRYLMQVKDNGLHQLLDEVSRRYDSIPGQFMKEIQDEDARLTHKALFEADRERIDGAPKKNDEGKKPAR